MSKVINIHTREEMTEMPLTHEEGTALMNHLLAFEGKTANEFETITHLMKMVANNSGVELFEFMWKRSAK